MLLEWLTFAWWRELICLINLSNADVPRWIGTTISEHHPAANGDGFAAQRKVEQLLDRCIEGIKVRMEDGGCSLHPDRPPAKFGN
jgi:hypothetical protein